MVSILEKHDFNPEEDLIQLKPREGEEILRTEDIVEALDESVAVCLLPGIQYYTGQLFDIETITRIGREKGIIMGWDLAHAAGNVSLRLHDWQVDFAVWCSYKYLNSGAGGVGGFFVHEKYHENPPKRLHGWWSNKQDTR